MDFHKLISRYKQFGGLRLVWLYAKLGLLPVLFVGFVKCLVKRRSFKAIYPDVIKRIEPFLTEKYKPVLAKRAAYYNRQELSHEKNKTVWFCWFQGLVNAPDIVKACYNSLLQNLQERNIIVIDANNWNQFVELPDYINSKWRKNQIPPALFSDLLRLQLLIKYGGTWIDSTVLCTGLNGSKVQEFKKYLEADLFLFQYTRPGERWSGNISNWFLTAHNHNEILMVLRDMLFAYWEDYNCTLDYYIFHLFFKLVAEQYPEQIAAMPYGYSINSLVLLHHWHETYDSQKWEKLTNNVGFHKLAFRIDREIIDNKDNYYNKIIEEYGHI